MKTYNFFVTVIFIIFMRKALTEDFFWGGGGIHENMNCAFPLKAHSVLVNWKRFKK